MASIKKVKKAQANGQAAYSLLVITAEKKLSKMISEMLPADVFSPVVFLDNAQEARRMTADLPPDIIIVDSGNGSETESAIDFAQLPSTVILLVPPTLFDETSAEVEANGVISLSKPPDRFLFYMTMKTACAVQSKIKVLAEKTVRLEEKMEEIRLVNRAKFLLMQRRGMSEPEAHRYIEKEAMDRCLRKKAIAESIIKTYGV